MSISHLIILGVFIALGSIGLAMMQSALSIVWRASSNMHTRPTAKSKIAEPCMLNVRIDAQ